MVLLACALSAGAALGVLVKIPEFLLIVIAVFAVFCAVSAFISYRRWPNLALSLFLLASFMFGAAYAGHALHRALSISIPLNSNDAIMCEGVLLDDPEPRKWGVQMDTKLSACWNEETSAMQKAMGSVRLNLRNLDIPLESGDRVKFFARFSLPRSFKDPGVFSYRDYLAAHGIAAVGNTKGKVEKIADGPHWFAIDLLRNMRKRVIDSLEENVELPERAVLSALSVGSQDEFTPELRDVFSLSGLAHILSISGLHVAYVALIIYLFVRVTLGMWPWLLVRIPLSRIAALVTIPAVWAFILFAASPIAAVRSGIMITVYLFGVVAGLRQDLLTTLALAVILILLAMPLSILDVSFQLSVLAVLGIALIAEKLGKRLNLNDKECGIVKRIAKWLLASLVVSLAASVITAPLVAYHFKFFTGIGLFANALGVPLSGFIIQPLVLAASAAAIIVPGAAHWIWIPASWSSWLLIEIARVSTGFGSPLSGFWAPAPYEVVLAYACIALGLWWQRIPVKKTCAIVFSILIVCDIAYWHVAPFFNKNISVTYFDVGQGDSALIRFPRGKTMLIDGGGLRGSDFDVGRNVLMPALLRMGVRKIDWIVLSHPHNDHYAGLAYIAQKFSPKVVWTNGFSTPKEDDEKWRDFLSRIEERGVEMTAVDARGVSFESHGATVTIARNGDDPKKMNDTSLTVLIAYGQLKFLFVGDLTSNEEGKLLAKGTDVSADVLKVGHHGSKDATSLEFLAAVKPKIAVISEGERNSYGFPHRDSVARIEASGSKIYRTDRYGAVTIISNGKNIEAETYVK